MQTTPRDWLDRELLRIAELNIEDEYKALAKSYAYMVYDRQVKLDYLSSKMLNDAFNKLNHDLSSEG